MSLSQVKIKLAVSTSEEPVHGTSSDAVCSHSTYQTFTFPLESTASLRARLHGELNNNMTTEFEFLVLYEGNWVDFASCNSTEGDIVIKAIPKRMLCEPKFITIGSRKHNDPLLYVRLKLMNVEAKIECSAELIVDTGFPKSLLLPQYKAHQLKLKARGTARRFRSFQQIKFLTIDYGKIQCEVVSENLEEESSTSLPVVCPTSTSCEDAASMSGDKTEKEDSLEDATSMSGERIEKENLLAEFLAEYPSATPCRQISPIKNGRDKYGNFVLVGILGMAKLHLGIHPLSTDLIMGV